MQPESAAFLWDVRAAGVRITTFADGLTAASYAADELRKSAVERQLEIIGEALNRLRKADPDVAHRIPDISRIIGLRNTSRTVTPSSMTPSSGAQSLNGCPRY